MGNIARYDTDAISCHCGTCHHYLEDRPDEHTRWFISEYGEEYLDRIREKHNQLYKFKPGEKEAMYKHYKFEREKVKNKRMDGKTGYIKIISWF